MSRGVLILFLLTLTLTKVQASEYTDEEVSYDAIIADLTRKSRPEETLADPLDNVRIHFSGGLTNSVFTVPVTYSKTTHVTMRGFQAALGIDLFSPNWIAEGVIAGFPEKEQESYAFSLSEFDIRIIYRVPIENAVAIKAGGGLAARYLSVRGKVSADYVTPSSIAVGGIEGILSRDFSLGVDIAMKNSLTSETPDQMAMDLTLRVDGHF